MLDGASLLLFGAATLALNLAPGPDMLYVSARSLAQGRRAGIISALGIAAGTVVHTVAIASGLAALLSTVPVAYEIVRWAGAGYLIWLGIQALRPAGATPQAGIALERAGEWAMFRQGMVTNLLNPKVALFFLAFLPQFVQPGGVAAPLQILALGCLFNLSGTAINIAVAVLAACARGRLAASERAGQLLRRLTGTVFIGLGLRLALSERH